jgi:hypothetical protein
MYWHEIMDDDIIVLNKSLNIIIISCLKVQWASMVTILMLFLAVLGFELKASTTWATLLPSLHWFIIYLFVYTFIYVCIHF